MRINPISITFDDDSEAHNAVIFIIIIFVFVFLFYFVSVLT